MGVLPLQFEEGAGAESLGLDGTESFTVGSIDFSAGLPNPGKVDVIAEAHRRLGGRVQGHRARRYADRGQVLCERGNPALRFAQSCVESHDFTAVVVIRQI